jgi:hypothetical protein
MKSIRDAARRLLLGIHEARSSIAVLVIMLASLAFLFLIDGEKPSLKHKENPALREARNLLQGRITLRKRLHDTAVYEGRIVNVFQPGQTLFFLAHLGITGERFLSVFQIEMFLIFMFSVLLCGVALLRLTGNKPVLAASLTASAMFGAPYLASLPLALAGSMYRVNHCLSIVLMLAFLILMAGERSGERRVLIGAAVGGAMLFRAQNVLLLTLPLSALFQDPDGSSWRIAETVATPPARKAFAGRLARLMIGPIIAIVIIAGFQGLRFHDPLQTGYGMIYQGRDDYLARRARQYGLFSLHYLPDNLSRTLWAFPAIKLDGWRLDKIIGDPKGNSLLFSQPILLLAPLLWRGLRSARAQSYLLASLLLATPIWLYHNPGYYGPGYNRLSLDYLPLWIAALGVFARRAAAPRWVSWITAGLAAVAVAYGLALLTAGVVA